MVRYNYSHGVDSGCILSYFHCPGEILLQNRQREHRAYQESDTKIYRNVGESDNAASSPEITLGRIAGVGDMNWPKGSQFFRNHIF